MEIKNNLLVIDGDFIPYYATQGNKVFDLEGNPLRENNKFVYTARTEQEVYDCVDNIMINIFRTTNIYDYIGFLGGKKCFRYDIYPDYKANRKDFIKPNFWQECKNYLIDRWNYQVCDFIEADDAVNITRNKLKNTHDSIIVTTDKDLIKCISGTYLNPRDFSIIYTDEDTAHYNFWASMIIGDTIDNIKGIPKCGKVFVDKLFKDKSINELHTVVQQAYIDKLGRIEGIDELTKNYLLLHIIDEGDEYDFIVPEIQTNKIVGEGDEW